MQYCLQTFLATNEDKCIYLSSNDIIIMIFDHDLQDVHNQKHEYITIASPFLKLFVHSNVALSDGYPLTYTPLSD